MLHRALSVYRNAEGRGVDVLEPENFHAGAGVGGSVQPLADQVLAERAQACNPRHPDFEKPAVGRTSRAHTSWRCRWSCGWRGGGYALCVIDVKQCAGAVHTLSLASFARVCVT